jgi:hypothetical protein
MGDQFFDIKVSETENFVLNYLIYCKPMEIFQNRNSGDGDGTGSRVN